MPSCSVPPSRISVLTFSAIEYSARGIGAFGGQNSARAGIVEQEVERIGGDQRVAVHEGQLAVHLADQRERLAARRASARSAAAGRR